MEKEKRQIAQNLAYLRTNSGMTQAELAERMHYSDKAISKWERGESVPDVFVLKQLADLFGVTVDDLLTAETPEALQEKLDGQAGATAEDLPEPEEGKKRFDSSLFSSSGNKPALTRTFRSISVVISGFSIKKVFEFSRP